MFNFENFSVAASLAGLVPFATYFAVAVFMIIVFVGVYTTATPHNELKLIKENNTAAAISFSGALIGYTFPLMMAMTVSAGVLDFAVWAVVAMCVQIALFFAIRIPFPKMICRIKDGETAMATVMCGVSIAVGLVNAVSMID